MITTKIKEKNRQNYILLVEEKEEEEEEVRPVMCEDGKLLFFLCLH